MAATYDQSVGSWAEREGQGADSPIWRPAELRRLVALRDDIASGRRHEETMESLRLRFGRWLYEHHRITDDAMPDAA